MEKYIVKVKTRRNAITWVAAAMLIFYLGLAVYRGSLPELPGFIKGFHTGVFIGAELCFLFFLVKYTKAVRTEAELKKLYIEENDERNGFILQSASSLSLVLIIIGLAIATVIAGFFNSLIFYTLLAALFFALIVFFTLWKYYSNKL